MTNNTIIFDCEIKHGVVTDNNPPNLKYQYAKGWQDFAGMGVSVICAAVVEGFDFERISYRVFCEDNFDAWRDLAKRSSQVLSFNGTFFDNPLLVANDLGYDLDKSVDLAALIWSSAGIPLGEHPKGLGLDAVCKANGIAGKTGNAADAPQDWQDGKVGRVIDYCLGDVRATVELYQHILLNGTVADPRTMFPLHIRLPR